VQPQAMLHSQLPDKIVSPKRKMLNFIQKKHHKEEDEENNCISSIFLFFSEKSNNYRFSFGFFRYRDALM